eukprot:TRINITY_DN9733_c0_g1_i1.p3 TRINITY_DN9733_c0_g1~~TRINITY_DN9733_c0_g1_i1.p3  ORF type:complete len:102 (-),score=9.64 TRINITY_DN9733_c0_g1_i1:374-679(-)
MGFLERRKNHDTRYIPIKSMPLCIFSSRSARYRLPLNTNLKQDCQEGQYRDKDRDDKKGGGESGLGWDIVDEGGEGKEADEDALEALEGVEDGDAVNTCDE